MAGMGMQFLFASTTWASLHTIVKLDALTNTRSQEAWNLINRGTVSMMVSGMLLNWMPIRIAQKATASSR